MAKKSDLAEVKRMQKSFDKLRAEIGKVIVAQEDVVELDGRERLGVQVQEFFCAWNVGPDPEYQFVTGLLP